MGVPDAPDCARREGGCLMMQHVAWICFVFLLGPRAAGGNATTRHGVAPELKSFPQATPKEALASVLKAVEMKRFDYLLAQLAEPDWVDGRSDAEGFPELV